MANVGLTHAFLREEFFGNFVQDYLLALGLFLGILLGLELFRSAVIANLRRISTRTRLDFDDFLVDQISRIGTVSCGVLALYLSTRSLTLNSTIHKIILILAVAVLTYRAVRFLQACVRYGLGKMYLKREPADPAAESTVRALSTILNWALFAGGAIFLLDNMGVNVSAVVAGLGIGGVAVALASQAILSDLFSSFTIYLDRPFDIGDFIVVGDLKGTVEHIGIKTTRLRSPEGDQLIFSNSDLTGSRIRNLKRLEERRVEFVFGVVYQTPPDVLKKIPGLIREAVVDAGKARFDRANLKSLGSSGIEFEAVYFILSPDYNPHMEIRERVNLGILERFRRAGIEFAYPTQTLFVHKPQ